VLQEVRWDRSGIKQADKYIFLFGQGNENNELGTGGVVQERIISAVKRVEFHRDKMLYIMLRGRWSNIIVLCVHASVSNNSDGMMASFYEELERMFHKFPE
jgi:hypothetical protein